MSVTHIESLRRAADKWLWNIRAWEVMGRDVAKDQDRFLKYFISKLKKIEFSRDYIEGNKLYRKTLSAKKLNLSR